MISKQLIRDVVEWVNKHYNQLSEVSSNNLMIIPKYKCIFIGGEMFGIILHDAYATFIMQDDGYWLAQWDTKREEGIRKPFVFSVPWCSEIERLCVEAQMVLRHHGKPYYYSGTEIVCGYSLEKSELWK